MNWLRDKIRNWLGIRDNNNTFLAADCCWYEGTAIVVIQARKNKHHIVDITHLAPKTPFREIDSKIKELEMKYGVRPHNVFKDFPL